MVLRHLRGVEWSGCGIGAHGRPSCGLGRRELLLGTGAFFAWAYLPKIARAEGRDPRLLVIVLRGALDGLAAVAAVPEPDVPWVTLVHNDPVNLMSYVTYVFQSYFGYPKDKARRLMLDVHHKGRAIVSSGTREEMERDVQAMHGYGLWATLQQER